MRCSTTSHGHLSKEVKLHFLLICAKINYFCYRQGFERVMLPSAEAGHPGAAKMFLHVGVSRVLSIVSSASHKEVG